MGSPSTRDEAFLRSFGSPPPTIRPDVGQSNLGRVSFINPNLATAIAAQNVPNRYIPMNAEIAKSYVINPTDQGQRAAVAQRQTMMIDPRNSPSRSQYSEGYTAPIQLFASANTWNSPSGLSAKGARERQPSTKTVSPFSTIPIPTRMPWDI